MIGDVVRTGAGAPSSAAAPCAFSPTKVRHSVESDATSPNISGWARRHSMSLHASPPAACINNA